MILEEIVRIQLRGLGGRYSTLISKEDYDRVSEKKWWARRTTSGKNVVVVCHENYRDANGKKKRRTFYLHRFLMDFPEGKIVDHADHNTLNNTRSNLRLATHTENRSNSAILNKSKTGYRGVFGYPDRRTKYRALIKIDGKTTSLGSYSDPAEAARVYDQKAIEVFGAFARLNFPDATYAR